MRKPAAESTVTGLVNRILQLERLEDYPSFTVVSIWPDFPPVSAIKDVLTTTTLSPSHAFCQATHLFKSN